MHGYDLPPPSMGSAAGPPPGIVTGPSPDGMHLDSTDSYVTTYMESDDSLPPSP